MSHTGKYFIPNLMTTNFKNLTNIERSQTSLLADGDIRGTRKTKKTKRDIVVNEENRVPDPIALDSLALS